MTRIERIKTDFIRCANEGGTRIKLIRRIKTDYAHFVNIGYFALRALSTGLLEREINKYLAHGSCKRLNLSLCENSVYSRSLR